MPVAVRNLYVDGTNGKPILEDISCRLHEGEITLVIGQTGAGKSTFLDALSGLTAVSNGSIQYNEDYLWQGRKLNIHVLHRLGNVFQYPEQQLFAVSVYKEMGYSLRYLKLPHQQVNERIRDALRTVGLREELMDNPPLLLSGGQKRRVALASTIAAKPDWLLLDEPTAGLDADSTQLLQQYLLARKAAKQGTVIVTHDYEALLPLADRVLFMHRGRLVANLQEDELHSYPEIWRQADIRMPACLAILQTVRSHGFVLPDRVLSAQELAEAVRGGVKHPGVAAKQAEAHEGVAADNEHTQTLHLPEQADEGFVYLLDPRAKWLFYMLVSIPILFQTSWLGLGCSAVIALIIVRISHLRARTLYTFTRPFLWLIAISFVVSGIHFEKGNWFELTAAMKTLFELLKILVILVLGVVLAETTSHIRMKRAMEQSLGFLRRFHLPLEALSLGASLTLRFIPIMRSEAARFTRIAKARGKQAARGVRFRQLPTMLIPMLLSVFQIASDLTLAMQARGYGRFGIERTSSIVLRMGRPDRWVLLASVLLCGLLWMLLLMG